MNTRSENAPRGRGRPRTDDKRRRILDAALGEFAARGYHGVRVPEVAVAADVGAGTLYRYFTDKEALVNEVFRDAKSRLRDAIFEGWAHEPTTDPYTVYTDLWTRIVRFARKEPLTFQFLEMQDHLPYLDAESRMVEHLVLAPMVLIGHQISASGVARDMPVDVLIALVWGALVGLFKAERLGYIRLDDAVLAKAGDACWAAIRKDPPAS